MSNTGNRVYDIFELIDELDPSKDLSAIMSRFSKYLAQFGFSSFLISGRPERSQAHEPPVILNGWSAEWFERYRTQGHYRNDPVLRRCLETLRPFTWDEVPPAFLEERPARRIMGEAADFGLAHGMSVPLQGPVGRTAIVTMAGRALEMSPEDRHQVHLASIYAHNAAEAVAQASHQATPRGLLTLRERDVLFWTVEGKTLWEIGEILGISEAAATAHLARIRHKIGAKTTAQAIVELIRRGELAV